MGCETTQCNVASKPFSSVCVFIVDFFECYSDSICHREKVTFICSRLNTADWSTFVGEFYYPLYLELLFRQKRIYPLYIGYFCITQFLVITAQF